MLCSGTLSLGYTTLGDGAGCYSGADLSRLLSLVMRHRVTSPLTLPLRASLLQLSGPQVLHFLQQV